MGQFQNLDRTVVKSSELSVQKPVTWSPYFYMNILRILNFYLFNLSCSANLFKNFTVFKLIKLMVE